MLIESVWPAATLIVPAVSSKVKLVLVRVRGWLTAIVPWLVTCAVRVRRPPVPTEELIVPVLTRVPAVTVKGDGGVAVRTVDLGQVDGAGVGEDPWATVSVDRTGVVVRLHPERSARGVAEGSINRAARPCGHEQCALVNQGGIDRVAAQGQHLTRAVGQCARPIERRAGDGQRRGGGGEIGAKAGCSVAQAERAGALPIDPRRSG